MADVAVDDGRISRIGDLADAEAAREIDATGKLVTPGFVDIRIISTPRSGGIPSCAPAPITASPLR